MTDAHMAPVDVAREDVVCFFFLAFVQREVADPLPDYFLKVNDFLAHSVNAEQGSKMYTLQKGIYIGRTI